MTQKRWEEYFYEWSWPQESKSAKDLAREVLGVSQTAETKDIKRAYRKLAREMHPDTDPSDKTLVDRFKIVTEAYEILTSDRNIRTRELRAGGSSDSKKPDTEPYPEWWAERFKDVF